MSSHEQYSSLSKQEFWSLFEQGQAGQDAAFYAEFQRRTQGDRHYNPRIDPQAWDKSTAALISFMDREGLLTLPRKSGQFPRVVNSGESSHDTKTPQAIYRRAESGGRPHRQ
nr:hypothetical protein [Aphanocapsa sp. GSE-SYN-MK-11-07L]